MAGARSGDQAGGRALGPVAAGAAVLCVGLAAYVLCRGAVRAPFSDEFDWIGRWMRLQADHDWASYLFAPHNLHRLGWTMAVLALDLAVSQGTNWPLIASGAVALAGMTWLLARQAARAAPDGLRTAAGAFAVVLALMPGNVLDAATPICVNYTHGAVFAVWAIVLAEGGGSGSARRRAGVLIGALVCAMAAAFGCAVGLAVWPVLAWSALRRRDWTWLLILLVVGGAFAGLYLRGQTHAGQGALAGAAADPLSGLRLSLSFLALPWARLAPAWAWVPGLGVAAVGVAALALNRDLARAQPAARVASGLILFTFVVAAMAGLGRADAAAAADVPLRYSVLVTPLHVGVLILALPAISRFRRARPAAAQACGVALVLALCAQDVVMARSALAVSDMIRRVAAEFRAGGGGPAVQAVVYPDLAKARRISDEMRERGLFQL